MRAIKSVTQNYEPSQDILKLLHTFVAMTNDCVRTGIQRNVSTLKRLSILSYWELKSYDVPSYYKVCAISRAAGILASRKKSIRRGMNTKTPYAVRPALTCCYGFKVANGVLRIPLARRRYFQIRLTKHTLEMFSNESVVVRSFTLTPFKLSLAISKEVVDIQPNGFAGLDRNLRNLTFKNEHRVLCYNTAKAVKIAETTNEIVSSFRRVDSRVRRELASKYSRRRRSRTSYLVHTVTKHIVEEAYNHRQAIVLEDIVGIRNLFRRSNRRSKGLRDRLNSWMFREPQRQVEYKAAWKGVLVIHLTKSETRGTSTRCPRCGERLQSEKQRGRNVWCQTCKRWMDRDVVAAMNLSQRGRLRFDRSLPHEGAEGEAVEAMKRNAETGPLILRVDASKLAERKPESTEP